MTQESNGDRASAAGRLASSGNDATQYWQQQLDSVREWAATSFGLPGWLLTILSVTAVVLLLDLLCYFLLGRLERRLSKSPRRWDDALVHGLRRPLRVWLWLAGICAILTLAAQALEAGGVTPYTALAFGLITLAMLLWTEVRLMKRLEQRLVFPPGNSHAKGVDQTSASAITKIVGSLTLLAITLVGLQMLGVSVSSLLALGGVGGILIGFAARDVMANFFGGMVIHLDKPFRVGHWIRSPDREIEGVVEDIGWRLTRIRTFAGPPIYVPNAVFSHIVVETPSRMHVRLLWETVGVRYQDAHAVEAITRDIADMLGRDDDIENDELITVTVNGFADTSINIMIYALTRVIDWQRFNEAKQHILLAVRDIIYRHGAELATPASRVYLPDEIKLRQARDQEALESDDNSRQHGEADDARRGSQRRRNAGQRAPLESDEQSDAEGDG
ncbi:mechanosensitive ion channel family protein [Kushneria aurantia]|uniref:Mechanosensitive ion channel family protein n=1 Tax=Kushneria aurantia TaxID=504092 RepID=A0ABV6G6R5_9GAMM|nr:mechanosensitive ion channel family protein [Kushneria aurantia]